MYTASKKTSYKKWISCFQIKLWNELLQADFSLLTFFCPVFRIFTLYSKSLPLDVACRVWDVFCRDGEEALFRTGLGILRLYQDVLLQMDFIHSAQFLSRLPENTPSHTLFSCIANTQMISNNRRWNQVWNTHIYNCERLVLIKCVCMCIWRALFQNAINPFE